MKLPQLFTIERPNDNQPPEGPTPLARTKPGPPPRWFPESAFHVSIREPRYQLTAKLSLDFQLTLLTAASSLGLNLPSYVRRAVAEQMKRDGFPIIIK